MDTPVLADQQISIFINSVWILDAIRRTCKERQTIVTDDKRESKESVLSVQMDNHHYYPNLSATRIPLTYLFLSLSLRSSLSTIGLSDHTQFPHRTDKWRFCWLTNTRVFVCKSQYEKVANEFVLTSTKPSMPCTHFFAGLCNIR